MDALALQLAQSIGNGPSSALRAELHSLLTDQIMSLILNLELCETPYRVSAATPNFLPMTTPANIERAWQVTLTQIDDSRGWEPLNKPNNFVVSSSNRSTPTLFHRLSDNGILHLRIQILHSSDDMNPVTVGTLVATATPEALDNVQLLRTIERLAAALSKHSSILLDFNTSVGNALFGTLHTHDTDDVNFSDDSSDDNEDAQTLNSEGTAERTNSSSLSVAGGILSIWTHGFRLNRGDSVDRSFFPHPFSMTAIAGGGSTHHVTAGLTFTDPVDEEHFRLWHARHMFQFDVVALSMCVLFHTLLLVAKIGLRGPFRVELAFWRWMIGYVQAVLLLFLASKRGKQIYIQHRDVFLLGLLAVVLWYHHSVVKNFYGVATVLEKCSGVVYGFLWIPVIALLLQPRFKWLMPAILATTAINLTLLGEICTTCDAGNSAGGVAPSTNVMRRCSSRGASKVAIMVGAALYTVYCAEWRARRVWASLGGPSR